MSTRDEELRKAFQDLQSQTIETKQQIMKGEMVKKANVNKSRISELTIEALKDTADGKPVYRAVGRLFVLSTRNAELARHAEEANQFREKAAAMEKQKEYLMKSLVESEKTLREMVVTRQRD